jgi:SAM-dependent methyltransferase
LIISIFTFQRLIKERTQENFTGESVIVEERKTPLKIYDKLYAKVYKNLIDDFKDKIVVYQCEDIEYNSKLEEYNKKAKILDIGCGTGSHVAELGKKYKVVGLDISKDMLNIAKTKTSTLENVKLIQGDMTDESLFGKAQFSHIICFYFSFYYASNLETLVKNCHKWLKSGGYFVVELIDRDKFDPVLEAANPFPLLSIQNYSEERITKSTIHFNNMLYESDFKVVNPNSAVFKEHLTFNDTGKVIVNTHKLNMPNYNRIVKMIKNQGFKLDSVTNLGEVNYNYHYIFYFRKN